MRILIQPGVPREVAKAVRVLVQKHKGLIPTWCRELSIGWDSDSDSFAYVSWQYEYRRAHITICPPWLERDEVGRDSTIAHEILHICLAPMEDLTQKLINVLGEQSETLGRWSVADYRVAMESVVCDLQHSWSAAK